MKTMKALVKAERQSGLWLQDVPIPQYGHNDVLIKIKKTAICGTDLHIYKWDEWAQKTIPVPMVIGHEFMGEIAAVGEGVKQVAIGDRVSGEGHITCGYCRNCRAGKRHLCRDTKGIGVHIPGAFAEYLSMPADNAYRLPKNISDDHAAILDPFGNAVHTALTFDLISEDVLITGAGPIGLMAIAIAKRVGARYVVVTDVNAYRLSLAKKMGATLAVNTQEMNLIAVMKKLNMREGFDVGLEMSGNATAFQEMLSVMNHGGRIAFLGIPSQAFAIDWSQVILKSLTIAGIYGRHIYETWYKGVGLLQSGLDISSVITAQYHYTDFEKAFQSLFSGDAGKVVLNWD